VSDIARDEHLRAALRHAPDATLAAPEAVSARILAAAHRAASEPAPAAPGRRRWWPLPVWQLGPSGALASVLLAGVVGLLWHDAPPGPARIEDTAQAPPAPPAGVDIAPPAAKAQPVAAAPAAALPTPRAQAPSRKAADTAEAAVPARALAAAESAPSAPPPTLPGRGSPLRRSAQGLAASPATPDPPWADALHQASRGEHTEAGDAAAAWLREVARQAQGPWRAALDTVRPTEAADFVLPAGGAMGGRLWLRPERVLWCDAADRCQQATLRPGAEHTLRQGLPPQPR